jgi:hypothetical protein
VERVDEPLQLVAQGDGGWAGRGAAAEEEGVAEEVFCAVDLEEEAEYLLVAGEGLLADYVEDWPGELDGGGQPKTVWGLLKRDAYRIVNNNVGSTLDASRVCF